MTTQEIRDQIDQTVKGNRVVIYMKGTAQMPRCGFSAATVECLRDLNVPFKDVDVLADPALRPVLQEYSSWPTIPQVFIDGKFIGGCDITRELHASGELKKLISNP